MLAKWFALDTAHAQCTQNEDEDKRGESKPPVEKHIGNDRSQPSQPVGHFDITLKKKAPGMLQYPVLVSLPGEKVG